MLPILSDLALREQVRALLPEPGRLPDAAAARIRLLPSRSPGHGDIGTDAALLAAHLARVPGVVFAARLAERLTGPYRVRVASSGFIDLTFSQDALDGILPGLLGGALRSPPPPRATPMTLPLATMHLRDPDFMVQHAHARCRSVLRAAADMPGLGGHDPAFLAGAARGWFVAGPSRVLLCRLEHWTRLAGTPDSPPESRRIVLFLRDLGMRFEDVWKASREHATLRLLYPADRSRSLANIALVLATAGVIRSGLDLLEVGAAEEIR